MSKVIKHINLVLSGTMLTFVLYGICHGQTGGSMSWGRGGGVGGCDLVSDKILSEKDH